MSLLKAEPPAPVASLEELFAIAHAMEHEAAVRYAELAERMNRDGNRPLGEVFERLSADERGHLDNIVQWSENQRGTKPDPALIRWQPETFDGEGMETVDPQLQSSYRALAMAVRNEERAFTFWTYVAAQARVPEVQGAAEAMAREELGHVATLRRERRQAFHRERTTGSVPSGARTPLRPAELESAMAGLLARDMEAVPSGHERDLLGELAREARASAAEFESRPLDALGRATPDPLPSDPVVLAELAAELYLEAADGLLDEEELERIQSLAGRAVARLAWLRRDLPELRRQ